MSKTLFWRASMILLSVFMVFSSVRVAHGEITVLTDIQTHWAKNVIHSWVDKGFTKGYKDRTFKPENSITRAEFIALINRSFGYTEKAFIQFTDATAKDWYYEDVAKAVRAGYTSGYPDGTIGANQPISREQAAVMISRLLALDGNVMGARLAYSDADDFAVWSIASIGAVAATQIMTGYKNADTESYSFKPTSYIKRAEAIVSLDRAITYRDSNFNKAGTYGPAAGSKTVGSNAIVNSSGVVLQNMTFNGNLVISSNVGEGDVTLRNVIVKGTTTINGGGVNSIFIENSIMDSVVVNKQAGPVRLVAKGATQISQTQVWSSVTLEEDRALTGSGFQTVILQGTLNEGDSVVNLKGAFEFIKLDGKRVQLSILNGTVRSMEVSGQAIANSLNLGTNVVLTLLTLDAPMKFTGQGTIATAIFNTIAMQSTFEKQPSLRKDRNGVVLPPLTAPIITSIIAENTGGNVGLGVGDSIAIIFDQNTNKPTITAANLNAWFLINNGHSFGTGLQNQDIVWNSQGNILTIKFSRITGTTFAVGDMIRIQAAAGIKNSTSSSAASTAISPASSGSFSPAAAIHSIVAADTGHSPGISVGDTITITFTRDMNRISISPVNLISWFIPNDGHSFGANSTAAWTSSSVLTITIKSIPVDPFVVGDRITISPAANLRDTTGFPVNTAVGTVVSTGSFSTVSAAPKMIKVLAKNTGGGVGLDAGDTLIVTFDRATNKPAISGKLLSSWFTVNNSHSLGTEASLTDAITQWDDTGKNLTIVFLTVSGTTFRFGDTLSVKPEANIRNDTGEIKVSTQASPPSEGTFTSAPRIIGFQVDTLSGIYDSILGNGDTVSIIFDQLTNKPAISGIGAAQLLRSWFTIKDNKGRTLTFTNLDDNNIKWVTVNGKDQLNITLKGPDPVDPVDSLESNDTFIRVSPAGANAIKDITLSLSASTADEGYKLIGEY